MMNLLSFLLLAKINDLWYALPLVVTVSLVYSATRHERMAPILSGALRFGMWVCLFMAGAFALLYWLTSRL